MKTKTEKRKVKLAGRKVCHGTVFNCKKEHDTRGTLTPKGTKPTKKAKKVYPLKSK